MAKRIVVCADGTWNQPNQEHPTNVVKAARAVSEVDKHGISQVVFYDPGIGSSGRWWDRIRGGATGKGLDKNVQDGYRYLVRNYEPGDELFFLGFSRGAYTIRSLIGLIRNVGLLKPSQEDKLPDAFALYRRRDPDSHPDKQASSDFRTDFSLEVTPEVKFVGLWDTVGALGIPVRALRNFTMKRYGFHDVRLSGLVQNAYQALAIDERRKPFRPSLWEAEPKKGQKVEQVWFVGVHTDVGGGNPNDGLADVTFEWMMDKAHECGLELNKTFLDARIDANSNGPRHNSMSFGYRILGEHNRPLGQGKSAVTEWVHATAKRRRKDPVFNYDPKNLADYLANNDERIAE
ncbi:MAG: DUF2235 domain-containing protein [Dehalococcoidia bacterium]